MKIMSKLLQNLARGMHFWPRLYRIGCRAEFQIFYDCSSSNTNEVLAIPFAGNLFSEIAYYAVNYFSQILASSIKCVNYMPSV